MATELVITDGICILRTATATIHLIVVIDINNLEHKATITE